MPLVRWCCFEIGSQAHGGLRRRRSREGVHEGRRVAKGRETGDSGESNSGPSILRTFRDSSHQARTKDRSKDHRRRQVTAERSYRREGEPYEGGAAAEEAENEHVLEPGGLPAIRARLTSSDAGASSPVRTERTIERTIATSPTTTADDAQAQPDRMRDLEDRWHTRRTERLRPDTLQSRSPGDDVNDVVKHLMEVRPRIRRADRVGTDRPSDPAHGLGEHEAAQRGRERRSTRSPSPSPERGSYPRQAYRCYPKDPGQKVSEQACREETNRQQPTPAETSPSQSHEGDKAPKRCRHMEWAR